MDQRLSCQTDKITCIRFFYDTHTLYHKKPVLTHVRCQKSRKEGNHWTICGSDEREKTRKCVKASHIHEISDILDFQKLRGGALDTAPGYFANHPQDLDRIAEWAHYRPQSQESTVRQMQASLTYDVSRQLDQIQVPTLVVHGELDPRVALENGRFLTEHITGARFILYPNAGHLVIIERAEEFNHDVLSFLQE